MPHLPITQDRLKELLHYDPETGVFTWLVRPSSQVTPGSVAGSESRRGYRSISVDGHKYLAHRLAFVYMTGASPIDFVDHINQNPRDNRWANLRSATQSQNATNSGPRSDNASGYKGVSLDPRRGRWSAFGTLRGRKHHLGIFSSPEEAAAVADAWRKEHHGEFYSCIQNPETLSPTPEP